MIFQLPPKHADTRRVFAYLYSRGIDPEIINHCIKSGQLYEDAKRHNCVFVGFEGDTPRYAALRGTLSQSVFVGEALGSDKQFSFAVPLKAGNNHTVCVFESAIDALTDSQTVAALGREIFRAKLHDHGRYAGYSREETELDANSAAYMFCRSFGIPCEKPDASRVAALYEGMEPQDARGCLDSIQRVFREMQRAIQNELAPQREQRRRGQEQPEK